MENSYVTPHDIKNYDQLSEIVWDKTWDTLTDIERKIAIDVAKYILDRHVVWTDNIRYFASESTNHEEKRGGVYD